MKHECRNQTRDVTASKRTPLRSESGQTLLEFAILLPMLLLLALGVIEMGRFAYIGILVGNAARSGVAWGAQNHTTAADTNNGIETAAQNDFESSFGTLSVTHSVVCGCDNGGTITGGQLYSCLPGRIAFSGFAVSDDLGNFQRDLQLSRNSDIDYHKQNCDTKDRVLMRTGTRAIRARLAGESGSALIEYAIAFIAFMLLMFGITGFGHALYAYHFVSNVARDASRWAAVNGATCGSDNSCNGVGGHEHRSGRRTGHHKLRHESHSTGNRSFADHGDIDVDSR